MCPDCSARQKSIYAGGYTKPLNSFDKCKEINNTLLCNCRAKNTFMLDQFYFTGILVNSFLIYTNRLI